MYIPKDGLYRKDVNLVKVIFTVLRGTIIAVFLQFWGLKKQGKKNLQALAWLEGNGSRAMRRKSAYAIPGGINEVNIEAV